MNLKNKIQLNDLMSQSHRTKSLSKGIKIVSKTKDPQICCIPHGRRGLAHRLFLDGKVYYHTKYFYET